jgi:regulator of sirC expression with transglutaminase-like and TPR domain
MSGESAARERFAELIAAPDEAVALDRVALAIAAGEYEQLDTDSYLRRLDAMATDLRRRLSPEEPLERLVAELNAYLYGEQGFHGNAADYYDPRNSYFNDVLERRTGIPITLSLLYIELGRRVGLTVEGVGLPGHFIARCQHAGSQVLVDPFNGGALLSVDDCANLIRRSYGDSLHFSTELLRPTSKRDIVIRMLGNLKGCYLRRGDFRRAARSVEWSLLADPRRFDDRRELGLLHLRAGDFRAAAADLEAYLAASPSDALIHETRRQLQFVQELWIRRN